MVEVRIRRLKLFFMVTAIFAGSISGWSVRHSMNPDGISYLDMGDALLNGNWGGAITAYWSPLYPALLGLGMAVLRPSIFWEFAAVHLVNFVIYLLALVCFQYFLTGLIRHNRASGAAVSPNGSGSSLPEWIWIVVGYTLFIWVSLNLITVRVVSPDLCVSALIYLIVGILLRIDMGVNDAKMFILLGSVLGLSYLTKTPMFPMAIMFLVISYVSVRTKAGAIRRVLVATLAFLIISAPLVFALSTLKGRFTIGDSGKLNYAWFVNGVNGPFHWQGGPDDCGVPEHPTRKVSALPAIYEFGTPVGGTYPAWYDPSYWYEGVTPHFDLHEQVNAFLNNAKEYWGIFFPGQLGLCIGCLILYGLSIRSRSIVGVIHSSWRVMIPAVAGLAMFLLVDVVSRYIGAYLLLFWLGIFSAVSVSKNSAIQKYHVPLVALMLAMPAVTIVGPALIGVGEAIHEIVRQRDDSSHTQFQIADGCSRAGLKKGERVGIIGPAYLAYWARLARVKVIAEMPLVDSNCWSSQTMRDRIVGTFLKTRANVVVAADVPAEVSGSRWQKIEHTNYSILRMP